MQWTHQRLIANHNGHRWDHWKSQRAHSSQLETLALTHLRLCFKTWKTKSSPKQKRSIPNFKTSIRTGIRQHRNYINGNKKKKKTLKQQNQPYPEDKNDNFTHPRADSAAGGRIKWIEQKGFTIWKNLDRFSGLG